MTQSAQTISVPDLLTLPQVTAAKPPNVTNAPEKAQVRSVAWLFGVIPSKHSLGLEPKGIMKLSYHHQQGWSVPRHHFHDTYRHQSTCRNEANRQVMPPRLFDW